MNSKSFPSILCAGSIIGLTVVGAVGCGSAADGPPRAAVNGTVTLDGHPLDVGTIRFVPDDTTQGPKTSVGIKNGWFDFPADVGPVVGHHRVEIETPATGNIAIDDESALNRLKNQGRRARITVVRIPAAYNSNSQLTAEISETGPNEFSFDLHSQTR